MRDFNITFRWVDVSISFCKLDLSKFESYMSHVKRWGKVGIYGFNSPEWFFSLLGAVFCGAKSAGIYPSDRYRV